MGRRRRQQTEGCGTNAGGRNWKDTAALVPGRTKLRCWSRWHDALNPSIALTAGRRGKWAPDEDEKLKDAVRMHGDKDWVAITALVPGRSRVQCWSRWKDVLDPSNGRAIGLLRVSKENRY
jgi:hypothetical protein